jgi:hypothetical protein
MTVFVGVMIIILGMIGIFAGRAYFRFKAARVKEYGKDTADFFEAVNPLISDDDTPTEILEILDSLNDGIMDRKSARSLLDQIIKYRGWKDKFTPPSEKMKIIEEFFRRRPELEKPFYKMLMHWFMAVTAFSPLTGWVVRFALPANGLEQVAIRMSRKPNGAISTRSRVA